MSNDEGEEIRRQSKPKRPRNEEASIAGSTVARQRRRQADERPSTESRAASADENRRLQEELAQEQKLRKESEKRLQASERRREVSERRREVSERRREVSEKEMAKQRRLREGTYYATIDQIWDVAGESYDNPACFDALRRAEAPTFTVRGASSKVYIVTRNSALNEALVVADDLSKSRTSISVSSKRRIWPTDIFGNSHDLGQIAHLIPASCSIASTYFDVVMWALGFSNQIDRNTLQKAIHGAKARGDDSNRITHSGIKHSVPNKICLADQGRFFDQAPCVFIIPIMELEEAKMWNGKGYSALVMCGSTKVHDASTACRGIHMTNDGLVASQEWQIEKSRQLLVAVILGMAHSLRYCPQRTLYNLPIDSDFEKLRNTFVSKTGMEGVLVPVAGPAAASTSVESLKVRVVEFSDPETAAGHPAPDPLLLAVKAAINWSRRHEQPLRAAGERPKEQDELDDLAEEEYLEWRDNLHRPKALDDLACGLGQPFGYQGEDVVNSQA